MRGGKSLVILLVLAAGLGAYIYFVESKRDLTDPELKKEKVFAIEPGKIEELEITNAAKEVTKLKKTGDFWQIVSPITSSTDAGTISTLVGSIESLETQRALEDNPTSVAQFGLDPARISVSFKLAGESTTRKLNLGNKTPTGSDLYARVEGQPKLFLVASYLEDSFNKSSFDLRDKVALKFDRDSVDTIALEPAGGGAVSLAKKGNDWRLTKPVDTKADFSPVDAMLNRASQAQMKAVVAGDAAPPTPAELKTFGLVQPQLVATFGSGSARATLAIGGKKDDATLYARDLSKPLVFTVESSLLTDLKKAPGDLRVKDVFEFKSYNAVSFDITQGGKTFSFAKSKVPAPPPATPPAGGAAPPPAETEVWKATKPEAKDVNQTAVADLLNTLSSFRAEKFEDRAATGGEEIVVVARFGDSTPPAEERVIIRKTGSVVHALRASEPGAAVVPAADFEKVLTQLKELTGAK